MSNPNNNTIHIEINDVPGTCVACNKNNTRHLLYIALCREDYLEGKRKMQQLLQELGPSQEEEQEQEDTSIPPEQQLQQPSIQQELSTIELEIHKLVNIERKKIGREQLVYDNRLADIAEKHSIDMQVRNFFSHTNPSRQNSFARAKKAGYSYWSYGENIAWYSNTRLSKMSMQDIAKKIMYGEKGWWFSQKGHKENLLSDKFDREGLGVWIYGNKVWATQNLALI